MRGFWLVTAALLSAQGAIAQGPIAPGPIAPGPIAPDVPALTRVMLSSGGVAYVEYAAPATGDATLRLPVPLEQVDDVLKSLVVFDSAGGVGGFTLPGRDGAQAAFGDVPFGPEALSDPLAYLNALRGVELTVRGPRPMAGRLLRAEAVSEPTGRDAAARRTRVSLLTEDGLRQFVLEEVESVQVVDPALRGRIGRALEALKRDAAQSTRLLTLRAPGTGNRTVRVGYVVGAPLWKVSYRVVLPAKEGARARLQGWAVLENTTGADWNGVEVALQYGNPVTFRQALYRSYFVQRPEVPLEVLGRILPGVDTRAIALADATPAPVPAPMAPASRSAGGALAEVARAAPRPPPPPMAAPAEAAAATEGAQETVFELPSKVTLSAGHTAATPILDREVTAARLGLVQERRAHPLAAIRLLNDTPTSLPAGVLTLLDPSSPAMFAGDARLGGLPAGESRLLSFAEDLRTSVTWKHEEATSLASLAASQGVLRLDERLRYSTHATLIAPAAEARDLLVEIGKRPGTTLVPDTAPSEETATAWRFALTLKPGETRSLTIRQDRIVRQNLALLEGEAAILRVMGMQGLEPAARAALQRLVDLRANVAAKAGEVNRLRAQGEEIERDQERIRRNLGSVPANDALHGRLLRQLEAQETRMENLRKAQEMARAAVETAQRELEAGIARFSL